MALRFKSVSATAADQTIGLNGANGLTIKNDGTNEIYFRLFTMLDPEPSAASGYAATTADATLTSSDPPLSFDGSKYGGFRCINIVCDTAETATVRLFYI